MIFKKNKIFCISFQRTGTTSTGVFFKDHGFKVADWSVSNKNKWSPSWIDGDFEAIFKSADFKNNQVFEDDPWWLLDYYKVLYHRFPNAKFILLTRDSESWFKSMISHSGGKILGNTKIHSKVYRREEEFYSLFNQNELLSYDESKIDNLLSLEGEFEHYKKMYELRNKEVVEFFKRNSSKSLFTCCLADENKWVNIGKFVGIKVSKEYEVHVNKSNIQET